MQMNWKFFIKNIIKKIRSRLFPAVLSINEQIEKIQTNDRGYFDWLVQHKLQSPFKILVQQLAWNRIKNPVFSILVPVFNTPSAWLDACVLSVMQQTFPGWELLLSDDASTDQETKKALKRLNALSSKIKVISNDKNGGISAATNFAADRARGEYLIFLDHDDFLSIDALEKIRLSIQACNNMDVFYSDEDRLSVGGSRYRHHFKPHFSPSLLEMCNYMLHLMCVRKECYQSLGGLRPEFDGSQDYDLLLRLFDAKAKFSHISDILYTWRESEASMAGGAVKPEIFINGKKALLEHITRRGEPGVIEDHPLTEPGDYWIRFELPKSIDLLIVTNGTKGTIANIPERYNCTIEIINSNDISPATQVYKLRKKADVVLFLADNVCPEKWELFLDELVSWAFRQDVGIVGAPILSGDDSVLHAGLTLMPPSHLRCDFEGRYIQNCAIARRLRDCFAVSGAVMAIEWKKLIKFMDEGELSKESWDIELCLRANKIGLRVVYNPHAVSRIINGVTPYVLLPSKQVIQHLLNKYEIKEDPYLNPHLISSYNDFRLPDQLPKYDNNIDASPKTRSKLESSKHKTDSLLKFSFLLPTYNSNLDFLEEMVESILQQTYTNFEVCISDDASTLAGLDKYLNNLQIQDSRFKINFADERGGIATNSNRCLDMATGDFIVLCDHDDRIESHALELFAEYIHSYPNTEIIYSDENIINVDGYRHSPHYRPDWNPDMLMSQMYFPHLITIKSTLIKKVGQFKTELSGSQDYDLILRATEQAKQVGHIPEILYSWRSHPISVAQDASAKMYAFKAALQALRDALSRRKEEAEVFYAPGAALGVYRIKRTFPQLSVSHIIAGETDAVIETIQNIQQAAKIAIEIIVIVPKSKLELMNKLAAIPNIVVDTVAENALRAEYYNVGAKISKSEILIFSPETVHIIDSDYPNALLEHTNRKEIGAVGCKLIYPNGFYYHTGLILGVNGVCGYAHRNMWQGPGYWYYANCIRNYSAVSWDLMAVTRKNWKLVGGFDETLSRFSDVDFCLKLINKGFRHVYTPYLTGVLNRSVHRLDELRCAEAEKILLERYHDIIKMDPNYHPLLSRVKEDFSLATN